jgi:hypothetical protein
LPRAVDAFVLSAMTILASNGCAGVTQIALAGGLHGPWICPKTTPSGY